MTSEQPPPVLLLAAHGTAVAAGTATLDGLAAAVRAARPGLRLEPAYLDVLPPDLRTVLAGLAGPVVVVPALLSTGYHVEQDVPAVVAGRRDTAVSAHLGPDARLTTALLDRLAEAGRRPGGPVALVATGSSRAAARRDVEAAAADLADRLGSEVRAASMADAELDAVLDGCAAVAPYLLAEGVFEQKLRERAARAGVPVVADVLGAHPAVVELVLARYDAAARTLDGRPVDSGPHPAR